MGNDAGTEFLFSWDEHRLAVFPICTCSFFPVSDHVKHDESISAAFAILGNVTRSILSMWTGRLDDSLCPALSVDLSSHVANVSSSLREMIRTSEFCTAL